MIFEFLHYRIWHCHVLEHAFQLWRKLTATLSLNKTKHTISYNPNPNNTLHKTGVRCQKQRNQNSIPSRVKKLFSKLPIPTLGPTQSPAMQIEQVVLSPVIILSYFLFCCSVNYVSFLLDFVVCNCNAPIFQGGFARHNSTSPAAFSV
jgi:hypothetical protein